MEGQSISPGGVQRKLRRVHGNTEASSPIFRPVSLFPVECFTIDSYKRIFLDVTHKREHPPTAPIALPFATKTRCNLLERKNDVNLFGKPIQPLRLPLTSLFKSHFKKGDENHAPDDRPWKACAAMAAFAASPKPRAVKNASAASRRTVSFWCPRISAADFSGISTTGQ
jgi:hypothetical protein